MRTSSLLVFSALVAEAFMCCSFRPVMSRIDYDLDSQSRTWHVHASVPAAPARALIVVLHGAGGSGDLYLNKNGWQELSAREHVIVIAPDGLPPRPDRRPNFLTNPRVWNSGQLNASSPRSQIDDVGFLADLIRDAQERFRARDMPVFMTGHSNGCGMTFQFAAAHPDMLTAIAPSLGQETAEPKLLAKGVPTLYMLGTADPLNPIAGGTRRLPWGASESPPVAQSIAKWKKCLGIIGAPRIQRDDADVRIEAYGPGRDGAPFEVWFLKGQGHAWPGGRESGLPPAVLGPNPGRVDATREIWRFFERYIKAR